MMLLLLNHPQGKRMNDEDRLGSQRRGLIHGASWDVGTGLAIGAMVPMQHTLQSIQPRFVTVGYNPVTVSMRVSSSVWTHRVTSCVRQTLDCDQHHVCSSVPLQPSSPYG